MSNLHALLIGIDYYTPNVLPGGIMYPPLGGCVRDINHVEAFLQQNLSIPPTSITKLTASNAGGSDPAEPLNLRPTHENILAAFDQLLTTAKSGDRVYIHYSGHGGRTRTAYTELKGDNGIDEAIVPTDIGAAGTDYLRDVDMAYLLLQMKDAGLLTTLILDSCHSGGATRGAADIAVRGVEGIDQSVRKSAREVAPREKIIEALRKAANGNTRSAKQESGWLFQPDGYVLLAACRPAEKAVEFAFDGRYRNGALTYWLLDTLRNGGTDYSYKMVHDRVVSRVNSQFPAQTPMLEGEGDLKFFGTERMKSSFDIRVKAVDAPGRRVQLDVGDIQGIQPGARFDLFPLTADPTPEARTATAVASQVDSAASWATVEMSGATPIQPGDKAILTTPVNVQIKRQVILLVEDQPLRAALEEAIAANGKDFIQLAAPGTPADFQVNISEDGKSLELWDAAGAVFPNLRPPLAKNDPNAPATLVTRMVHLVKYKAVDEIRMLSEALNRYIDVRLVNNTRPNPAPGDPQYRIGDELTLYVKNNLPAAGLTDPSRDVNVALLDLESDWSINQVYPSKESFQAFETVSPGQELPPITFQLGFADIYASDPSVTQVTDHLKIFLSLRGVNFRWLEMPPLDTPLPAFKGETRRGSEDPLEALFAAVAKDQNEGQKRSMTAIVQKGTDWTVRDFTLPISR